MRPASSAKPGIKQADQAADDGAMPLSPFAGPRSTPRRPDIGDTRPFTRQARIVVGSVPLAIGILGEISDRGVFTFWTGLALAGAVVTAAYSLSLRFEGRHLDETREFWLCPEARNAFRPNGA
jgi:hypothetical protein